jgi:hypothetical protein
MTRIRFTCINEDKYEYGKAFADNNFRYYLIPQMPRIRKPPPLTLMMPGNIMLLDEFKNAYQKTIDKKESWIWLS